MNTAAGSHQRHPCYSDAVLGGPGPVDYMVDTCFVVDRTADRIQTAHSRSVDTLQGTDSACNSMDNMASPYQGTLAAAVAVVAAAWLMAPIQAWSSSRCFREHLVPAGQTCCLPCDPAVADRTLAVHTWLGHSIPWLHVVHPSCRKEQHSQQTGRVQNRPAALERLHKVTERC